MMNMMNTMKMNQMNQVAQNNMTITRLKKEFNLCSQDPELKSIGCKFIMEMGNFYIWRVTMNGPENTPYQGGIFTIRITFPFNYPKSGPEFRFLNKIYHLNVDFTDMTKLGHICLSYLNEWQSTGKVLSKKCYGVKQALYDIFCLFYNQGIESAYDKKMAQDYMQNPKQFETIAKQWTMQYAQSPMLS